MDSSLPKILAVAGPTASGKSALAAKLALKFGGQVISCDAMQIYRGMDVGTGKVTADERLGVRHRMLDILSPDESFSPVLCGGTGLYLDRLLDGTALSEAPANEETRAALEARKSEDLYKELLRVDPESARGTHPNNRKRVIRALEIYHLTGQTKTSWDKRSHGERRYEALRILLLPADREGLYRRIDARVDAMFEAGLEEEARALFSGSPSQTAAQAIGYKEFLPYFNGKATLGEVRTAIQQASRNYAKRQMTWFRRMAPESLVIDSSLPPKEQERIAEERVRAFLTNRGTNAE